MTFPQHRKEVYKIQTISLYTHQDLSVVQDLIKQGWIRNNGQVFNPTKAVHEAYRMITDYAYNHISKEFITYPIWCWYKQASAEDTEGFRIDLEVPSNLVLLIDYYDWGGGVLYNMEILYDLIQTQNTDSNIVEQVIHDIETDFNNCVNQEILRNDIQAIIPYIKLEWVTNIIELRDITKQGNISP